MATGSRGAEADEKFSEHLPGVMEKANSISSTVSLKLHRQQHSGRDWCGVLGQRVSVSASVLFVREPK